MGLAFASKYKANHLVWAQNWPQTLLPMVLYGPITGPTCAANGLAWAQHWPKNILLMALYGPRTGPKIWCQWPCMGPALASKCATGHLVWAQHWPQTLLPMVLYGPILVPYVLPVDLHKPCTGPKYSTDGIVWAHTGH